MRLIRTFPWYARVIIALDMGEPVSASLTVPVSVPWAGVGVDACGSELSSARVGVAIVNDVIKIIKTIPNIIPVHFFGL